jgi:hypothetical protein
MRSTSGIYDLELWVSTITNHKSQKEHDLRYDVDTMADGAVWLVIRVHFQVCSGSHA